MNKQNIYHYLNIQGVVDQKTDQLIDECIKEVLDIALFKAVSQKFILKHNPLQIEHIHLASQDLQLYFKDCDECLVVACTLGVQIDRKIKYYEHIDMSKAVVFDAVSNAYLEECQDEYEQSLHLGKNTFRFAPGYGDIPLNLNYELARVLQIDKKIGVSINQNYLFLPMKSMLGIIGLGKDIKKTCLSCIRENQCELRKKGLTCYVKD